MVSFDILARANVETAELLATHPQFDNLAAGLLVQNAALAAEHLDARHFTRLSTRSMSTILRAAEVARDVAPLLADQAPYLGETSKDYQHRLHIWHPLYSLQAYVEDEAYPQADQTHMSQLKSAIKVGSAAFAAILSESKTNRRMTEVEHYFWENTDLAASRLNYPLTRA